MSAPEEQSESDRDQITQQNAKSPLLRLPAELRNQIFALALTQPIIEIFWSRARWRFMFSEDCRPDYVRQPLNLLFVCRQTHAETATLPYKLNTFAVDFVYQRDPPKNFLYQRTVEQREVMWAVSASETQTLEKLESLCPQRDGWLLWKLRLSCFILGNEVRWRLDCAAILQL